VAADRLDALAARVEALAARVDALAARVDDLAAPATPVPPAEDAWERLGLAEGERRTVTVLFADVSGFTALSEALDAEAVQLVMRDTMSLLAECVQAEGGTLEKFIGDAVCAIFGAPVGHPDEPERAARSALAMHAALAERAAGRLDLPALSVHAGINTGPVIAGAVGDGTQFGVLGDTTNTAARLMDLAADGQTFVSSVTARRLRRSFRLRDAGTHVVKGKAEPLAAWELVGELSPAEREEQRGVRTPFVGRDAELAAVRELARGAAEGRGAVALAVGPPGAGASRLAAEVAAILASDGWRVLRASARAHSEVPLGIVAAALAPVLDDAPDDLAPEVVASLVGGEVEVPPDLGEALGRRLGAAAQERPLLVVLDDVDGADRASLDLVLALAAETAEHPVLWLLTGERAPSPLAPGAGGPAVLVPLGRLADADVAAMIDGAVPGALDGPHLERLARVAEGSPQYAVEIVHALVEEGVVAEAGDGTWRLVGDPSRVAIPGTVAELVEAQIDRLPTRARLTLQDAAVIGQRFSEALLRRVATSPASVDVALAELADAELVVPPGGDGDDATLWSFRSQLVREVTYESLLRRRRPAAHRAVADALLELEPDHVEDNADLLAHHFEASDEPALAVPHLLAAIERAVAAHDEAGRRERSDRAHRLLERFADGVDGATAARLRELLDEDDGGRAGRAGGTVVP
jgi:adenylate cyclase